MSRTGGGPPGAPSDNEVATYVVQTSREQSPLLQIIAVGLLAFAVAVAIATASYAAIAEREPESHEHCDQEQQRNDVFAHCLQKSGEAHEGQRQASGDDQCQTGALGDGRDIGKFRIFTD